MCWTTSRASVEERASLNFSLAGRVALLRQLVEDTDGNKYSSLQENRSWEKSTF